MLILRTSPRRRSRREKVLTVLTPASPTGLACWRRGVASPLLRLALRERLLEFIERRRRAGLCGFIERLLVPIERLRGFLVRLLRSVVRLRRRKRLRTPIVWLLGAFERLRRSLIAAETRARSSAEFRTVGWRFGTGDFQIYRPSAELRTGEFGDDVVAESQRNRDVGDLVADIDRPDLASGNAGFVGDRS